MPKIFLKLIFSNHLEPRHEVQRKGTGTHVQATRGPNDARSNRLNLHLWQTPMSKLWTGKMISKQAT